jgi:hypothetical protein
MIQNPQTKVEGLESSTCSARAVIPRPLIVQYLTQALLSLKHDEMNRVNCLPTVAPVLVPFPSRYAGGSVRGILQVQNRECNDPLVP